MAIKWRPAWSACASVCARRGRRSARRRLQAAVLPCPFCKLALPPANGFCPACRIGVRFQPPDRLTAAIADIRPGAALRRFDFRTDPLPGERDRSAQTAADARTDPTPHGSLWTFGKPSLRNFHDKEIYVRDACAWAQYTIYEPGLRVGLSARWSATGEATTFYALELWPATGTLSLRRVLVYRGNSESTLLASERVPSVAIGKPVMVELRAQGSALAARVDGVPVFERQDPIYGVGNIGLRFGREHEAPTPTGRILCQGFAVHGVVA